MSSATIVSMAQNGMPPRLIARQLALKVDKVYAIIRKARSEGADIPFFSTRKWVPSGEKAEAAQAPVVPEGHTLVQPLSPQIVVPIRLHSLLVSEAKRIGWTPSELAQHLLEKSLLEGWSRNAR